MGKLKYLVIHCLDTKPGQKVDSRTVIAWHMAPPPAGNGWDRPGYYKIILEDGRTNILHRINDDDIIESHERTWGAKGVNSCSVHIAIAGGYEPIDSSKKDFFRYYTDREFLALKREIIEFVAKHPDVKVCGHYQVDQRKVKKTCPKFNVPEFCRFVGIPKKNIL